MSNVWLIAFVIGLACGSTLTNVLRNAEEPVHVAEVSQ